MLGPSLSNSFGRVPHKGGRAFVVLGVVAIVVNLCLILAMFSQRPINSEEAEIISGAISLARESMTVEWTSAEAKYASAVDRNIIIERTQLHSLYRLRVFVVATEAEVTRLPSLLTSLMTADYSGRTFPIDVELHILGKATGLPLVQWPHGRLDVYAHRLHGNANPSVPFAMADVWQPQSNFELGLPLTASTVLSPHWFQWVQTVVWRYASTSPDEYFHLERVPGQRLLMRSPLSQSLSGMALGSPVAGPAEMAGAAVLSHYPSAITVFTADYWKALVGQAANGVDLDDVAAATWKSFLAASVSLLGTQMPQFLYAPVDQSRALACGEVSGAAPVTPCSVSGRLDEAALEKLLRLPDTLDRLPRMQGQAQ